MKARQQLRPQGKRAEAMKSGAAQRCSHIGGGGTGYSLEGLTDGTVMKGGRGYRMSEADD